MTKPPEIEFGELERSLKGLCTLCRTKKKQCPQIYIKLTQFEDNDGRKKASLKILLAEVL